MDDGEELSKYEERIRVDVVEEYNTYSTNFYNMLKECEFVEETPGASLTASRDSSPAGASGGARGLGKFIIMPQTDPSSLTIDLSHADAKKYVERFNNYMMSCYPGGYRLDDYKNLLGVRLDRTYEALIGNLKDYLTEEDLKNWY